MKSSHKIQKLITEVSPRELEIIDLIAHEYSTKQIAQRLFISFETVRSHKKNLFTKLQVTNGPGLVRAAFENRLLKFNF